MLVGSCVVVVEADVVVEAVVVVVVLVLFDTYSTADYCNLTEDKYN